MNNSVYGEWRQAEWRLPCGDWRYASSAADAQWQHADGERSQTMSEYHVSSPQPKDTLDADALRAVLMRHGVGAVHRSAPRERRPSSVPRR